MARGGSKLPRCLSAGEVIYDFSKQDLFHHFRRVIFVAVLFVLGGAANAAEATDNSLEQDSVTGPEQHDTSLISIQPWVVDGEVVGSIASYVYKDVTSERPVDYWELYDKEGGLLAVSWFDQFGIQRTAIDRGIVEQENKLEGIFIVVLDGNLI